MPNKHRWLADEVGLQNAFWLALAYEVYNLWYVLRGANVTSTLPSESPVSPGQ